jgi:hypothetical protein
MTPSYKTNDPIVGRRFARGLIRRGACGWYGGMTE